ARIRGVIRERSGRHAMMDETKFWKLIAESRAKVNADDCEHGDEFQDRQVEHLKEALRGLDPKSIRKFQQRFDELAGRLYRWDIWGAAYWEGGGCGDDGFM